MKQNMMSKLKRNLPNILNVAQTKLHFNKTYDADIVKPIFVKFYEQFNQQLQGEDVTGLIKDLELLSNKRSFSEFTLGDLASVTRIYQSVRDILRRLDLNTVKDFAVEQFFEIANDEKYRDLIADIDILVPFVKEFLNEEETNVQI